MRANQILEGYESIRKEEEPFTRLTTKPTKPSLATMTEPVDHDCWISWADHPPTPSGMCHQEFFAPTHPPWIILGQHSPAGSRVESYKGDLELAGNALYTP